MTTTPTTRVPTPGEGNGVDAFFERCDLHPQDARLHCLAAVDRLFLNTNTTNDDNKFEEANPQGYCSYTLCHAGQGRVVQFRPSAHRVDPAVCEAARGVYGPLAPRVEVLETLELPPRPSRWAAATTADEGVALHDDGCSTTSSTSFQVLSMSMTPGVPLSQARAAQAAREALTSSTTTWRHAERRRRESLVAQFAHFIALGWKHRRPSAPGASHEPAAACGRVGSSMRWRLEQMAARLPPRFRPAAQQLLLAGAFESIRALPWVLTHGDIVPANVMVVQKHGHGGDGGDSEWAITGFLDWAEAEYLPFGVGLYGLEELLGEADGPGGSGFRYYTEAPKLRALFWSRLAIECEEDGGGGGRVPPKKVVESAHVLGMLLWHGIAFDDGRLDRVVDECRDKDEIQRLDAFFASVHAGGGKTWEESGRGEQVVEDGILGAHVRSICMAMS